MQYFEPIYALKAATPFCDKMGGRPQGFKRAFWPECKNCGRPQSFVAQFIHHLDRLDLGREGRVLYIFQCGHNPGMCETWEHSSGANACVVLEPEELVLPRGAVHPVALAKSTGLETFKRVGNRRKIPKDLPPLINEVFVSDWKSGDDGVEASDYIRFFNDKDYFDLPVETTKDLGWTTRLGGVPTWVQSANEYPKPGWRYIGQLGEIYSFNLALKRPPKWVWPDDKALTGRTHYAVGPNFGGGIAYLFLESRAKKRPHVKMFWQC